MTFNQFTDPTALMHALKFSEADLNAHRDGYLLRRKLPYMPLRGDDVLMVVGWLGISWLMHQADESGLANLCLGVGLVVVLVWFFWRFMRHHYGTLPEPGIESTPYERDVFKGHVEKVQGDLIKRITSIEARFDQPQLEIGGRLFVVSSEVYAAFLDRGYYAIYYLPMSQHMLSAELLSLPEGSEK